MDGYRRGQTACLEEKIHVTCAIQLQSDSPLLRRWLCLCLGKLWETHSRAKWAAVNDGVTEKLFDLLHDSVPEVRAASTYALGAFIGTVDDGGPNKINKNKDPRSRGDGGNNGIRIAEEGEGIGSNIMGSRGRFHGGSPSLHLDSIWRTRRRA